MIEIRAHLDEYVALHRCLGYKFGEQSRLLRSFVTFMEAEGKASSTTDLALRWATASGRDLASSGRRLNTVRRFTIWLNSIDPRTEILPAGILPCLRDRKPPFIYTDGEIARILLAASQLPSQLGLRARTYVTLFGLLAATGMRMGEARRLEREDVDIQEGVLTVRWTKFGKSRPVPVHPTVRDALEAYAAERDRILPVVQDKAFFLSELGIRLTSSRIDYTFAAVSRQVGIRAPAAPRRSGRGPRLHDLRHRFAVLTLVNWYRAGVDVEREMPKLSTYLGHSNVNGTYWYIEAFPELLQLATDRLTVPATFTEDRP